ncbi:MAG TPA: pyridoxal phosphate-dependent aminotransferase, partial [Chloroflexota bacterium]
THYGPSAGLPELREAVAAHVRRTRGIAVDPEQVVITPGGKPIMFFTLLALVEEGDEVIYPDPGFPIYASMANFVGARPVPLPLRESRAFRLDPDELASLVTPRTRLLILNSPHNPTGSVLTRDDLAAIAEVALKHDLMVLSDEIYSRILYEGEHHSIASFPGMAERTIILDGFSKTYAMTGWRLGYGIVPPPLVAPMVRLVVNSVSCTAPFTQLAGLAALEGPQHDVERMVAEFARRRALMVDGLNAIPGIRCLPPQGAFYVFPNIQGLGLSSAEAADRLLEEAGVATLSGTAFGQHGEGYLRLSYANSRENLERALERIDALARAILAKASPAPPG